MGNGGIDRKRLFENQRGCRQPCGIILHETGMAVYMADSCMTGDTKNSFLLLRKQYFHKKASLFTDQQACGWY